MKVSVIKVSQGFNIRVSSRAQNYMQVTREIICGLKFCVATTTQNLILLKISLLLVPLSCTIQWLSDCSVGYLFSYDYPVSL